MKQVQRATNIAAEAGAVPMVSILARSSTGAIDAAQRWCEARALGFRTAET
jgi:hypothetical protein